jgi:PPOX class probable F420-dependent enzyme
MHTTASAITLPDSVRAFLAQPRFATIATSDADGRPRQAVIWYLLEGDELVVNSRVGRRWPTNLLRDHRISVAVIDAANGLDWVGLTGIAEPVTDQVQAQADIAAMARRYETPEAAESSIRAFEQQERISFRVRVDAIHDHRD